MKYDEKYRSEISRLHGDHDYGNKDFPNAIENYKKTVKHLEPSYVIKKFLDDTKIDMLISYLEYFYDHNRQSESHSDTTALLLNCYVKQKMMEKLEAVVKNFDFDSNLFDVTTAINVCIEQKMYDLAINLA